MINEVDLIRNEALLDEYLKEALRKVFSPGENIIVKLHMGEPGNVYYINPSLIKLMTDTLRDIGCNPSVFDTPVVYNSPRNNVADYLKTAAEHGYTEHYLGVPVLISNRSTEVKGKLMEYHLAADPIDADGVLLVSHVKGHIACGMGGAIKNIGMGCVSKTTKAAIHTGGEPYYTEGCTQCQTCVENCPTQNIRIDGDVPRFDRTWCPGCSNCVLVCPENCIQPKTATFDELLSEAAVLSHERYKKLFAVNVLKNITRLCDCVADSGPIVLDDIGYICGSTMLSVDIASLEMIKRESGKEDLFSDYHMRSPWGHVRTAAKYMGTGTDVAIKETG